MNVYLLLAALAGLTSAVVHGVIAHRILLTPLTPDRLFPTGAFGDADMSRRILLAAWHIVTAAFACSAIAMGLLAFGVVTSPALPFFVSVMHGSFLVVGLWALHGRLDQMLRTIPLAFVASMSTVCVMGWLGSG